MHLESEIVAYPVVIFAKMGGDRTPRSTHTLGTSSPPPKRNKENERMLQIQSTQPARRAVRVQEALNNIGSWLLDVVRAEPGWNELILDI